MTDALIAELERAPGGSREISDEILLAAGWTQSAPLKIFNKRTSDRIWHNAAGEIVSPHMRPDPSQNLQDAHLTKNSDWVLLHASEIGADGFALVVYGNPGTRTEVSGIHSRLEIAWCIAALKTRKEPE